VGPEATNGDNVVFIVDDDAGVRSALQMLVKSLGLPARTFASGEEFLKAYDGSEGSCVLLDVRMPGMSGFDVRERLAALGAQIPIIFLTAQAAEEVPRWIGSVERIQKPFHDEPLVSRIRELAAARAR
jgi:FixJ family two-component response regulator